MLLYIASQVVHEIRNYPYPQLQLLALQGLNPNRHTSAVRESYEVSSSLWTNYLTPNSFPLITFVCIH